MKSAIITRMKGTLFLAEAATVHPDSTVSVLRMGINKVTGSGDQIGLSAALVVRIETDLPDTGSHRFKVRTMDMDGRDVLPPQEGIFDAPTGGGSSTSLMRLAIAFPKPGRYCFYLLIDDVEHDSWAINVIKTEAKDDESSD